jgi:hypothetical protein
MQRDAAKKIGRHKSARRHGLAVGLGLIACASFANDPIGAQRIFRCEVDGRMVFSDLPCTTVPSIEVVLRPTNSYHADTPAVSPGTRKIVAPDQSTRQSDRQADAIAAEQQRAKLNCQRMADQLIHIENTMRSGYSGKQGERLRERQRQLEQRRRTERCR